MNGGKRPNQGRGTANQNEPGRGKHPHLSRRGTIQITMINIIHIMIYIVYRQRGTIYSGVPYRVQPAQQPQ